MLSRRLRKAAKGQRGAFPDLADNPHPSRDTVSDGETGRGVPGPGRAQGVPTLALRSGRSVKRMAKAILKPGLKVDRARALVRVLIIEI